MSSTEFNWAPPGLLRGGVVAELSSAELLALVPQLVGLSSTELNWVPPGRLRGGVVAELSSVELPALVPQLGVLHVVASWIWFGDSIPDNFFFFFSKLDILLSGMGSSCL